MKAILSILFLVTVSLQADPGAIYPKFNILGIDSKTKDLWVEMNQQEFTDYMGSPEEEFCPTESYESITIYQLVFESGKGKIAVKKTFPYVNYEYKEAPKKNKNQKCSVGARKNNKGQNEKYEAYKASLSLIPINEITITRDNSKYPAEMGRFRDSKNEYLLKNNPKPNSEDDTITIAYRKSSESTYRDLHKEVLKRISVTEVDGINTLVFEHAGYIYLVGNDYSNVRGFRFKQPK